MKTSIKISIPVIILGHILCVSTCLSQDTDIYTDNRDGKIYKTIKIGDQIWFAGNLAYNPVNDSSWSYDNIKSNEEKFGRLYNWNTAQKVCPSGWHLPDNDEWNDLINFYGNKTLAGRKLKASYGWNNPENEELKDMHLARPEYKDTLDWNAHLQRSDNGINILPAGKRTPQGEFQHLGNDALFWSSTAKNSTVGWKVRLNCNVDSVGMEPCYYLNALSVRCVKDK
ncbi:MAG: FISUMP domain-containing protein [Bacteroidota bacterium]